MILSVEGLGEVHHACQDGSLVCTVLAGQDKVNELNYVVGYGIALKPTILPEVNFILDVIQQPHYYKMFTHLAEEGSKGDGAEVFF